MEEAAGNIVTKSISLPSRGLLSRGTDKRILETNK